MVNLMWIKWTLKKIVKTTSEIAKKYKTAVAIFQTFSCVPLPFYAHLYNLTVSMTLFRVVGDNEIKIAFRQTIISFKYTLKVPMIDYVCNVRNRSMIMEILYTVVIFYKQMVWSKSLSLYLEKSKCTLFSFLKMVYLTMCGLSGMNW